MTTGVEIDAHAGWPVEVVVLNGEENYPKSASVHVVEPGEKRTFYLHSGARIVSIVELKKRPTQT